MPTNLSVVSAVAAGRVDAVGLEGARQGGTQDLQGRPPIRPVTTTSLRTERSSSSWVRWS